MRCMGLAILAVSIGVGFVASAQPPTRTRPQANIAAGKELFHQNCSICHGVDAKGYRSKGSGSMYDPNSAEESRRVPPGDLTVLSEHNAGKFPADRVRDSVLSKGSIPAHGTPEMPAWGHVFDSLKSNPKRLEQRLRDLTAFLESIHEPGK
jgi:mono/diheme cytochrome c family protein